MKTPAETHDWLVREGTERFIETFTSLFARMSEGGYTPGVTVPSKAELRKIYESTNENYWKTLKQSDPQEAQSQLAQFKKVSD